MQRNVRRLGNYFFSILDISRLALKINENPNTAPQMTAGRVSARTAIRVSILR